MKEIDIQNSIRKALSDYGIVLRLNVGSIETSDGRRFKSGLPNGTSDLLFIGKDNIAFIEVKTEKGRVSKEQQNFIDKIRSLGHTAGVARSVKDAILIINNIGGNVNGI